ncbi:MAG: 4-(cytidine 5'-diphospho)-2-C-methyl-D-erythritol kinase [Spirochaetia bacterium]|nr:4-(cytidine 5'-diphospho)-2-C-methyl-D-erythritol kinase [Spirochaetia bacterium]
MITLPSPAKINIGLRIHHRRQSDGYHYLSSIFVPISFSDEIILEKSDRMTLTTENLLPEFRRADFETVSERGPNLKKNLLWRALEVCAAHGAVYRAHLIKRIPSGAGLGGGSSNAGTVLGHCARESGIKGSEMAVHAEALGADVPFFLAPKPQLVFGTGHIMEEIAVGAGKGILCIPDVIVPTGDAYLGLKRPLQADPLPKTLPGLSEEVRKALGESDWKKVRGLENDFEEVVFSRFPELGRVKERFYHHGAAYASLTGSGSALFALVSDDSDALLAQMTNAFPGFVFQTFSFNPAP